MDYFPLIGDISSIRSLSYPTGSSSFEVIWKKKDPSNLYCILIVISVSVNNQHILAIPHSNNKQESSIDVILFEGWMGWGKLEIKNKFKTTSK